MTMKIYHLRNNLMICMNLGENLIVGGGGQVGDTVYQPRQTETQVSLAQHIANMYIFVKICLKWCSLTVRLTTCKCRAGLPPSSLYSLPIPVSAVKTYN